MSRRTMSGPHGVHEDGGEDDRDDDTAAIDVYETSRAIDHEATLADGDPRPRDDEEINELSTLRRIDRFSIERRLGAGAMGVVFAAHDDKLDRPVALKLLRAGDDETERARMRREAQALARLSHPNVVQVFEVGTHRQRAYLVMERVEGTALDRWLRSEARAVPTILEAFLQAGEGLAAAHAAGLVHRDFKPGNVLVGDDGRVRVLDFGLARAHAFDDAEPEPASVDGEAATEPTPLRLEALPLGATRPRDLERSIEAASQSWSRSLTRTGAAMGTPAYMAPEQYRGHVATAASDQFAFCVALYEALWGQHPFSDAHTWQELAGAVIRGEIRAPGDRADVPARVRKAVRRGLASEPAARFDSMQALLHELRLALRPTPWWRWLVIGAIVAAVGAGVAWWWAGRLTTPTQCTGAEVKLAEVWGPPQRERVQQAITRTDVSFAAQTWDKLRPRLDDYAARWARAHAQACEATVAGQQDARTLDVQMVCLQRLRRGLGAQVEVLGEPDAAVVREAVGAVMGLADPKGCLELDADDAGSVPDDPALAAWIEAMDQQVDRIDALRRSGRYSEGLHAAEQALAEAERQGHEPSQARVLLRVGDLQEKLGASEVARDVLERAYFLARRVGEDDTARSAASRLISVTGVSLEDHEAGMEWVRHAEAELGTDAGAHRRSEYLNDLGLLRIEQGELDEALAPLREALALREEDLGPDHPETMVTLGNLGIAQRKLGHYEDALASQTRVVETLERLFGTDHPFVGQGLANLAPANYAVGRIEEAEQALRRSIEIQEAAFGPTHSDLSAALNNLGIILDAQGKSEPAEQALQRSIDILEASGVQPHSLAVAISNLAYVQRKHGNLEQAVPNHRRALALYEEAGMESHPDLAQQLSLYAGTLHALGRLEEAEPLYARALEILDHQPVPSYLVTTLTGRALLRAEQGHHEEALALVERLQALTEGIELKRYAQATIEFVKAQARWADVPKEREQAIAQARAAAASLDGDGASHAMLREMIERWLAAHGGGTLAEPASETDTETPKTAGP